MSRAYIDQALIGAFQAADLQLPTAYANYPPIDPDTGDVIDDLSGIPWCRVTIIPARPTVATMGLDGKDQVDGIMQVDLFYPKNQGTAAAHAKADEISEAFKAGSVHSRNGVDVHVDACGRVGSVENPDNHQTIVQIAFHSWLGR